MCHRSGNAYAYVAALCFALAGCGSTPEVREEQAPPVQAEPETAPAAETFPLESNAPAAGQQSASAPPSATPPPAPAANSNTAATTKIPPKSNKATPAATAAEAAPVEAPLPPEAVQQFDNAVAMVSAGNLAAAEQAFRALSTAYPSYSGPLVNLGILHAKAGRLDEAEKTLRSALERKADNAAAYNQLGMVYRRQGRFKDADEAYSRAVQVDPNYANAYLNLGVLCDLYLQQPQRALEAFERYLSLVTTPDEKVGAWVKELKVRLGNTQRSAEAGS